MPPSASPNFATAAMLSSLSMLLALMMSSALISVGHGALGALIVQQGGANGFSDGFIGLLITVTYIGFVAGNMLFSWLLPRISYIRTFSVCAAIIACSCLLMPLFPQEAAWLILRFIHGLFFSTTVVICESWLNITVDNKNRGKLHSTYMTVNFLAYGGSQYILLLGQDGAFAAFALTAMFIVLSLVPVCMTRFTEPLYTRPEEGDMKVSDAFNIAPLAYISQICCGMATGASWLFVRYADSITDYKTAATLAVLFFGGGFALQFPIGLISDRVRDRRTVITAVYAVSAALACALFFGRQLSPVALALFVLLFGMVFATSFSLNVAYGQDFAGKSRASQYAGRLFQPFSAGAIVGPLLAGAFMDAFSEVWLFAVIAAVCAFMTALSFTQRFLPRFVPVKQSAYQPVASAYAPTVGQDLPLFGENEIGPAKPEQADDVDDDAAPQPAFVGPRPLDDEYGDGAPDFVGPQPVPVINDTMANDDDGAMNWRK